MTTFAKRSIGISALALGLLVAATSAGAFGGRGGHGGRWQGGPSVGLLEHRLERLDLSSDVRAKAFAIVDASRGEDRTLREQIRAAHEKLRTALASGAPDAKSLDAQVDALGALNTRQHKHFLHTLIEVGTVLPVDQREQWFAPPRHRGGDLGGPPADRAR